MAVWQFDLRMVPRDSVCAFVSDESDGIGDDMIDAVDWWRSAELPAGWEARVDQVLPRSASWDPEWRVFGSEQGTRVDVISTGGRIEEVRLRLDARELGPSVLEQLMELVKDARCSLVTPTGRVIEPDPSSVWVELELSPARKYVRDPSAFLNDLSRRREASGEQ